MEQFWTTIATCASAAAAFIALGISVHQTRLSNKQHLLDRRLSIWLAVQGLLELYGKNRALLKKDNEPQLGLDVVFSMLANNAHLCDIALAASHPLVEEYQRPFLVKLDELKRMALESAFVFKGRTGVAASAFLSSYQRLLFEIYQYCVLTD